MSRSLVGLSALLVFASCTPGRTPAGLQRAVRPVADTLTVRVTEGTELVATLSPDGRRLAIIVLGQVFLVDRAGGEARALTDALTDPAGAWSVAWAPNSRHLVVKGAIFHPQPLRLLDVETGGARLVSRRADLIDPVWTRDARSLVVGIASGDSTLLYSYPVDERAGDSARLLRVLPHPWAGHFALSPDGRRLAYASALARVSGEPTEPTERTELWEVDLQSGLPRKLLSAGSEGAFPSYSPDGKWIAYLSGQDDARQVWLVPTGGESPRSLTRDARDVYLAPLSWTPDARSVLYTAEGKARLAPVDGGPGEEIAFSAPFRVLRWAGLRRPEIPEAGTRKRVRGIADPELSPDGDRVAFAALGDLWIASTQGEPARRLTHTPAQDERQPRWSPDGRRLAYVATAPGHDWTIRVLEVSRPEASRPIAMPPGAVQFSWSPDGRRLGYAQWGQVGWVDVSTGEHRVVAAGVTAGPWWLPGWTANGDSVVFSTVEIQQDTLGDRQAVHSFFNASAADSGRVRPRGVPFRSRTRPRWAGDQSRVAYAISGVGYYEATDSGSAPVRIQDPAPHSYSWSADGRKLLYLSRGQLRLLGIESGVARTLDVAPEYEVAKAPAPLLVRNVRIIDGRGSAPTPLSDVLVEDGRIRQVAPTGSLPSPATVQVVDGAGRTLLPGLIDMHVHLFLYPSAPAFLYYGVLGIRDLGTEGEWVLGQREQAEAVAVLSPRTFLSAGVLTADYGLGVREADPDEPQAVADEIESLLASGAEVLKVYHRNARFEAAASRAAHARGLRMTSHHFTPGAFAHGQEGKEHSWAYYRRTAARYREDLVSIMRAAGTCFTPTFAGPVLGRLLGRSELLRYDSTTLDDPVLVRLNRPSWRERERERLRQPLREAARQRLERLIGWGMEATRRLHEAGVPVTAGTDHGPDGLSLHYELELLVKAGLTPLEAIRAATLNAATCLGVENELGSIEPGKRADFILVNGDPSKDIRDARNIHLVVLGGRPLTRAEILEAVPRK